MQQLRIFLLAYFVQHRSQTIAGFANLTFDIVDMVTSIGSGNYISLFKFDSEATAASILLCPGVDIALADCINILFAATVGVEIDRLIGKYGRLSPTKALLFQAIGAERIEALCDAFCADIKKEYNTGLEPRFSPGYGDLPLSAQKNIFAVLDPERRIGLTLNSSLLMSPSKSVTAFVGLGSTEKTSSNKCSLCEKTDCTLRGV